MKLACLALLLSWPSQTPAITEAEAKSLLFPYYARQAAAYSFFLDERHTQPLILQKQPLLTWTNAADNYLGGVYVWTLAGRPEVVGCIGSRQTDAAECIVFHELHSLSPAALDPAKFGDGQRLWQPPRGVELLDAEDAPKPAASALERLTQMRNLARSFQGWMKQDGDTTELRLLPQPIFRYSLNATTQHVPTSTEPLPDILDGALFAFVCKGTDPDVLLLLEDRLSRGKQAWQFAFVRFNWCELWAERGGKEVWRVPQSGLASDKPFISGRVTRTTLRAIADQVP